MIAPARQTDIYHTAKGSDGNGRMQLGYDATESKGKRRPSPRKTTHEDIQLPAKKRKLLTANGRDQLRNFPLVGWMIRTHISYVSQFDFKIRTPNADLNKLLKRHFAKATRRENFDIAKRHNFNRAMALFEMSKAIEGDAAMVKIKGGPIQLLESELIAKPTAAADGRKLPKKVVDLVGDNGLILNREGAVKEYCICRWDASKKTLIYDRMVKAENVFFDGYFTRVSQTRGVSPLSAALNSLKDLHESFEWTSIKIKLVSLMGIVFKRDGIDEDFGVSRSGYDTDGTDEDGAGERDSGYELDFSGGLMNMDLNPGDDAHVLESKTPFDTTQSYWDTVIRNALLTFDIPYALYNGKDSNLARMKGDKANYERSAKEKRANNRVIVEDWAAWQVQLAAASNPIIADLIAETYGDDPEALLEEGIKVIATGTPLLDRKEDVEAAALEIANGLNSRQNVLKERGLDFFDILEDLAVEEKAFEDNGVTVTIGQPGSNTATEEGIEEELPENE